MRSWVLLSPLSLTYANFSKPMDKNMTRLMEANTRLTFDNYK